MIKNRQIVLIYRCLCFIFILAVLCVHIGIFIGEFSPGSIMYYTVQSNLLALIMFGTLLYKSTKVSSGGRKYIREDYYARFEVVCVMDLLLTLVVYWALLAPNSGSGYNLWNFDNLAVHLITPLMCLADYILFSEWGHMKYRDVYAVLIYPLCYVIFASISGFMGYAYGISPVDGKPIHFPYFFLDFDRIGFRASIYIAILIAAFLLFAHTVYIFDKNIKKPVLISENKNMTIRSAK